MSNAIEELMIPMVSSASCRNPDRPEVIRVLVTGEGYQGDSTKSFQGRTCAAGP